MFSFDENRFTVGINWGDLMEEADELSAKYITAVHAALMELDRVWSLRGHMYERCRCDASRTL